MKTLLTLFFLCMTFNAIGAEGVTLQSAHVDLEDRLSLQRGAKHFVTYCLGCHSAKHIRYLRIAVDLGLDEKHVLKDIAPEGAGIYDQLHSAMNKHDAEKWFGIQPPDLSLIARSRSADWLYSYLKGFYIDANRPFGVNNAIFEDVGMPNPFWKLQGEQKPVFETHGEKRTLIKLVNTGDGIQSSQEFDRTINDLVNFLVYVGEPVQLERQKMGKFVLFFIFIFTFIAYLLKKDYWKDVH
jgi:ubiquinol-cytochrome c reductase cytochrome c1 subunit